MEKKNISLNGNYFRREYVVYIIEIIRGNSKYYYIGQTGDNKHLTARPGLRRLFGHLDDVGQSTQNQIYRYIATKILEIKEASEKKAFSEAIKQKVEDFIVSSTINMHIYSMEVFNPDVSKEQHMQKVHKVCNLENALLQDFVARGKNVLNEKIPKKRININNLVYLDEFNEIKEQFSN